MVLFVSLTLSPSPRKVMPEIDLSLAIIETFEAGSRINPSDV